MLQEFVDRVCSELQIEPIPKPNEHKIISFNLNKNVQLKLKELNPGVSMQAVISQCPERKREELFLLLMRANFLGQGTAGARIGLDRDEKFLTLSLGLPYEMNYQSFKENLEDFVNYLVYWRDQIAKFEQEETLI
ncbi:MAG: type III secretion system chaperone [Verrucomicrobia bacterium]|nr:type III secretion system chaperone [Verrucomicrobiota bacterium]